LVRFTKAQVRPPPETLLTVVLVPLRWSVEMKASNCSLPAAVENAGLAMVVLADAPSCVTVASTVMAAQPYLVASASANKKIIERWITGQIDFLFPRTASTLLPANSDCAFPIVTCAFLSQPDSWNDNSPASKSQISGSRM